MMSAATTNEHDRERELAAARVELATLRRQADRWVAVLAKAVAQRVGQLREARRENSKLRAQVEDLRDENAYLRDLVADQVLKGICAASQEDSHSQVFMVVK